MQITVLMPIGGIGKRFKDAGFTTPKPLISIDGSPMFIKALETFPDYWDIENIFIIRKDQNSLFNLGQLILEAFPDARIVVLEHETKGAVETAFSASSLLDPYKPVVVADCDIRFSSAEYIEKIESKLFNGVIVGFESDDPRYSYAEIDRENTVIRTAEKIPISTHALLGGYYFDSGATFLDASNAFIKAGLPGGMNEFYLSHLYNILINEGKRVAFANADTFDIWGTPEELFAYLERSRI